MMRYTHVIWDIDNTMLDTEEELMCALIQALREKYGVERSREELWFAMVMPAKETVRHLGIPEEDQEEVRRRWNQLTYTFRDRVTIFPGVEEALTRLRDAGVGLGVVTARTREAYRRDMVPLGLGRYFETVVCADDTQRPKPDPEPVERFCALTGAARDQVLMIGDSASDMKCCRAAGIHGALALWGKGADPSLPADYHVHTPAEAVEAVLGPER